MQTLVGGTVYQADDFVIVPIPVGGRRWELWKLPDDGSPASLIDVVETLVEAAALATDIFGSAAFEAALRAGSATT